MLFMGLVALTACSEAKSYPSEIQFVVGKGGGDAHKIKKIVYPGEKAKTDGDEESWYVPGNARNFIITNSEDRGDRKQPVQAYTAGSATNPAMQVNIYLSAYWSLNQNEDVLRQFLPFCEKYTCYSKDHDDNDSNFASKGWNGMLAENFSPAIDRAVIGQISNFDSSLYSDPAKWQELADLLGPAFMNEVKKGWASESTADFFCGNGSAARDKNVECTPVRFVIDKIEPVDPRVVKISQDRQALEQQKSLNAAQIAQAQEKYGTSSGYFLGMMDLLQQCADLDQQCIVVLGGADPQVQITSPAPETK